MTANSFIRMDVPITGRILSHGQQNSDNHLTEAENYLSTRIDNPLAKKDKTSHDDTDTH